MRRIVSRWGREILSQEVTVPDGGLLFGAHSGALVKSAVWTNLQKQYDAALDGAVTMSIGAEAFAVDDITVTVTLTEADARDLAYFASFPAA